MPIDRLHERLAKKSKTLVGYVVKMGAAPSSEAKCRAVGRRMNQARWNFRMRLEHATALRFVAWHPRKGDIANAVYLRTKCLGSLTTE